MQDPNTPNPKGENAPLRRVPIILLFGLGLCALAAAFLYNKNPLNKRAQDYAQSVAVASASVYVSLRTVNAFLSTAQEVEIGGALVVQGTVQPLKTLEPIDDTIERIASLVFTTMVITGLVAVAMGPISAVGAALICAAVTLWICDRAIGRRDLTVVMARRLTWYGAFLAIALPASFLISAFVADRLTDKVWSENTAIVSEITAPIQMDDVEPESSIRQIIETAEDYSVLARNIYDRADTLIGSYIAILAVFLFKILILPSLLVGAFLIVARFFAHRG